MRTDIGKGKIVRVVSPSGPCGKEKVLRSKEFLEGHGFSVQLGPNVFRRARYLAGSDEERLYDLVSALEDSEVDIVWFSRGGYGSMRLIENLPDYSSKKEKLLAGYSDSTAIFCWASRFKKLSVLYGPSFSEVHDSALSDHRSLWAAIGSGRYSLAGKRSEPCESGFRITGGCLSIVSSLTGTEFFPRLEGKFLFLEDVNEPLYRIDRMMTQLFLSGCMRKAEGLILGSFENTSGGTVSDIHKRAAELTKGKIPLITGIRTGHNEKKRTIHFNREARWDGKFLRFS